MNALQHYTTIAGVAAASHVSAPERADRRYAAIPLSPWQQVRLVVSSEPRGHYA